MAPYNPTQTGCNTHVPTACAKIPVVNGATAPPLLPAPPINPIAVVCTWRGIRRENTVCAQGYTGPRSRPSAQTATALPMRFGVSHARSWRAVVPSVRSRTKGLSPIRGAACVRTKRPRVMPP